MNAIHALYQLSYGPPAGSGCVARGRGRSKTLRAWVRSIDLAVSEEGEDLSPELAQHMQNQVGNQAGNQAGTRLEPVRAAF